MNKSKIKLLFIFVVTSLFSYANLVFEKPNISLPNIEDIVIPTLPTDDKEEKDENGNIIGRRILEKNTTVYLESKVKLFVPLEIISDIDIETMVVDNQKVEIPFEIEMNKEPERKDYYRLKYSEDKIDIDMDGELDTFIYSSPFINTKILKDNIIYIDGGKISKEGTFKKKVYMTIEIKE